MKLAHALPLILLTAAQVAGCAYTAEELRQEGERIDLQSKLVPRAAAGCIARALESYEERMCAILVVSVRDGEKPNTFELGVSAGPGAGWYIYGMVEPVAGGSQAKLWLRPALVCHSADGMRAALEAKCR